MSIYKYKHDDVVEKECREILTLTAPAIKCESSYGSLVVFATHNRRILCVVTHRPALSKRLRKKILRRRGYWEFIAARRYLSLFGSALKVSALCGRKLAVETLHGEA